MYSPFDIVVVCELLQDEESLEQDKSRKPVFSYALRVLEYNSNAAECLSFAEAPRTPDRLNDFGLLKVPDQLSEANLFYGVAPGAMQAYRESMECLFVYNKEAECLFSGLENLRFCVV